MEELGICELPVDPFLIAKRLGIIVDTYSLCERYQPDRIRFLRKAKCEAIASKDPHTDEYHILYDDCIAADRVRFTIAHEIGHVWMGHVEKYGYECQRNGGFRSKNHPAEKEADNFAGELLRPPVLMALLDKKDVYDIQSICNVSFGSATIGARQAKQVMQYKFRYCKGEVNFYSSMFHAFIHQKHCPTCKNYLVSPGAKHCPICGGNSMLWGNPINSSFCFMEDIYYMIYDKWNLTPYGKALQCPRCQNDEINHDYNICKICNTTIINKCAGKMVYYENGYEELQCCETIADGNARYCIKCGAKTTFFEQKLLVPWEEEKKQKEAHNKSTELPSPPKLLSNHPLVQKKKWQAGEF